jgi:hypothetical protein
MWGKGKQAGKGDKGRGDRGWMEGEGGGRGMNVHCCYAYSADAEALRLLHAAEESVEHILISVQIGQLEMSPGWSSLAGSSREGGRGRGKGDGERGESEKMRPLPLLASIGDASSTGLLIGRRANNATNR